MKSSFKAVFIFFLMMALMLAQFTPAAAASTVVLIDYMHAAHNSCGDDDVTGTNSDGVNQTSGQNGGSKPDINVKGHSVSISDGDTTPSVTDDTDFGSTLMTTGVVDHTFTIENTGTANLNLSGTPKVGISGVNAADFSVTSDPTSPVSASGSTSFNVRFNPKGAGLRSATIRIANNDCDENPYNFAIQGTATDSSSAKDITAFSFTNPAVVGVITGTNIAVTVPFGTDITALVASFTTTTVAPNGVEIGGVTQESGVTPNDFTTPKLYTVHAEDSSTKVYTVTVTVAPDSAKNITAFSFAAPNAQGVIIGTDITVHVPVGTDLTALVPTIVHTGVSINPNSGVAQNFTNPVIYTVTAADGSSQNYTVTVIADLSVNTPPVAVNDAYSVFMSTTLNGSTVLANDTDADANPLTAIKVADPLHAASFIFNANGTFTYTPVTGFQGDDSFTYMANDGSANSNIAKVTIKVAPHTIIFKSVASNDGWVLETSENSNVGGIIYAAWALRIGDATLNRQYRSFTYFDTSILPDNVVILSVTLKFKLIDQTGSPFTEHGALFADMRKGILGNSALIEPGDFQFSAAADQKNNVGVFSTLGSGWYQLAILNPANFQYINVAGPTQFRLHFALDDNNDGLYDYVRFYAGEAPAAFQPQLVINYYVP
jgi:hypothetical protein